MARTRGVRGSGERPARSQSARTDHPGPGAGDPGPARTAGGPHLRDPRGAPAGAGAGGARGCGPVGRRCRVARRGLARGRRAPRPVARVRGFAARRSPRGRPVRRHVSPGDDPAAGRDGAAAQRHEAPAHGGHAAAGGQPQAAGRPAAAARRHVRNPRARRHVRPPGRQSAVPQRGRAAAERHGPHPRPSPAADGRHHAAPRRLRPAPGDFVAGVPAPLLRAPSRCGGSGGP
mmetsp:Transcript_68942/g.115083  ORF Transcript_68942/g.115083 Transcript_68942/m.115083 type:complete len:232 (+) Transcript_68942:1318-2013(+)